MTTPTTDAPTTGPSSADRPTPNDMPQEARAGAPAPDPEGEHDDGDEFDADRAKAKITKVNSEASALRKRLKEAETKAARLDEIEAANKSEAEKLSEDRERLQFELQDAKTALTRERVARKYGLDDELVEFLPTDGDEDVVEAKAKYLASRVNRDPQRLPDPSQGSGTTPENATKDAAGRAFFGL